MTDINTSAGDASAAAANSGGNTNGPTVPTTVSADGKKADEQQKQKQQPQQQQQSQNAGQQDTATPTFPSHTPAAPHSSGMVRRPSSSFSSKDRSVSSSRRGSKVMLPPPAPLTGPAFGQPPSPGGSVTSGSEAGVGAGPGPARLPKPLTPAEIHAELEKEQEAAVNRLTRQLSILRAQQSPTTNTHLISDDVVNTYPPTVQLGSRSRRTSSNASTALTNAATVGTGNLSRQSSLRSLSSARAETQSAPAVPTAAPIPSHPYGGLPLSRTSSVRSIGGGRESGRNSPALGETPYPYFSPQYYHGMPTSSPGPSVALGSSYSSSWRDRERDRDGHSQYAGSEAGGSERGGGVGLGVSVGSPASGASGRYEEVLMARTELESVRKENEKLRERIRELERGLDDATKAAKAGGQAAQAAQS